MNSIETNHLTVPLGRDAHAFARQFAAEQTTPQKGKKIYLNTLAVYAVHSYLKWLQIESDLSQGDGWHSGKRALFDVADLMLPSLGKLECRPVLPGETVFSLPPEVTENRIGYVAVQFNECLDEVKLLGFVRASGTYNALEQIHLAELQPLDVLLDCIPSGVINEEPVFSNSKMQVNLSHWLQNVFETGWQTVETLLLAEAAHPAFSFRRADNLGESDQKNQVVGTSGGKLIDLGMQLSGHPVALIVTIAPAANQEVDIRLRVYPTGGQIYLPPNLRLIVIDESGATTLEAQARNTDNWVQLEFSGEVGEHFNVQLALGDVSITEDFII